MGIDVGQGMLGLCGIFPRDSLAGTVRRPKAANRRAASVCRRDVSACGGAPAFAGS